MSTGMHNKKKFQIEERRRQVADLDAQFLTEQEIAEKLGVDQTTVSRDIRALKLISQQFIYDITKSDFAYYYKQCIDAIRLVLKRQWEIANNEELDVVIRLNALDKIKESTILLSNYYDIASTKHRSPTTEEIFQHDRDRPKILRGAYLVKGSGELDPNVSVLGEDPTEMDYSNRKF